ncbi:MAG TPA: amidase [Roseiflexaceae bacterium]|nr:amidase [Roseiflexaceae bacterium]
MSSRNQEPDAGDSIGAPVVDADIAGLQQAMAAGRLTAADILDHTLARIAALDQAGPCVCSVIELNPAAGEIAALCDAERAGGLIRGPLHGIPVLLKDNIDTADAMHTTAGSLALLTSRPPEDATVAARLKAAGAVIIGKANMSEWANFRSTRSVSGWSARGGQCRNPHVLDRSPCGSSSGSAAAVAAALCVVALGSETDGSIVCPSGVNGVVGIKPTVGLTSRAGVIPIAHSQDTIGPHARSVADAAVVLNIIAGPDPRDPATVAAPLIDYTRFLDRDGLRGARIGVARERFFGRHPATDLLIEAAIADMRQAGATIIDPANIATAQAMADDDGELTVLLYEFRHDIAAYLATRVAETPDAYVPRTLADLIDFNRRHAAHELPFFGQELFEQAVACGDLSDALYTSALARNRRLARTEGIDAVLDRHQLDALVAPTTAPAWPIDPIHGDRSVGSSSGPAALAGYPLITVPAGMIHGLPVGLTFMGRAWSEPLLIRLAYAYEQATQHRARPRFHPSVLQLNTPTP